MIDKAFDTGSAAEAVIRAMLPLASADRAVQEKRYLKSDLRFLGVPLPGIRRAVTAVARSDEAPRCRDDVLAWAQALWREPVHEQRMAAVEVLRWFVRDLEPADLPTVEAWIRQARGWAYVDPLAASVAGPIALQCPQAWPGIDAWAVDQDFWVRRAALLTLLPGIRQGGLDQPRFERYATPMLAEREFFIAKAIGWVLRETSKKDPAYVAGWTARHLNRMSGVTFREAVRRLPAEQADELRAKRARRKGRDSA